MIDIRKLKELVRLMVSSELTELDLRDSEEQVTLRRHVHGAVTERVNSHADHASARNSSPHALAEAPATPTAQIERDAGMIQIESPMVGTFYSAPNPDAFPFVSVGSSVGPDTVVCIVEAMKIFNEIKAECAGTITKILARDGESVEYGQSMFLVKPD